MSRGELIDRYLAAVPCTRSEVFTRPSPIPAGSGVYGWWFRQLPAAIDFSRCERKGDLTLIYAGISPSRPPANGKPPSQQNIRKRVAYHYRGNAEGSTPRKTLGCLLADELGIELRRVGSGTRRTFGSGEAVLSQWMADNALVSWTALPEPWLLERERFNELDMPLNIQGNAHNQFHQVLTGLRTAAETRRGRCRYSRCDGLAVFETVIEHVRTPEHQSLQLQQQVKCLAPHHSAHRGLAPSTSSYSEPRPTRPQGAYRLDFKTDPLRPAKTDQ